MKPVYKDRILNLRSEYPDWTVRQIAEKLGCHHQTVRYWLSEKDRAGQKAANKRYRDKPENRERLRKANAKWWREHRSDVRWWDEHREAAREADQASRRRRDDRIAAAKVTPEEADALQAKVLAKIGYRSSKAS